MNCIVHPVDLFFTKSNVSLNDKNLKWGGGGGVSYEIMFFSNTHWPQLTHPFIQYF